MKFKSLLVIIFFLSAPLHIFSQTENERKLCCCSNIIEKISEEWKKDSLANNDFRLNNGKLLLTCKLDSLSLDFLLQKLGKPSHIQRLFGGTEYRYYSYDIRTRSKNFDGPSAAWGVVFYIRDNEKYVSLIDECDIDIF